jgi:hypothetical protein
LRNSTKVRKTMKVLDRIASVSSRKSKTRRKLWTHQTGHCFSTLIEWCILHRWQSSVNTYMQMFCCIYGQVYGENILKSGVTKMGYPTWQCSCSVCAGIADQNYCLLLLTPADLISWLSHPLSVTSMSSCMI